MDYIDQNNGHIKAQYHCESIVERDSLSITQNVVLKEKAFLAMEELEGWCTKFKASVLIDLIMETKSQVVVEIGVWGGKSLVPMAYALKEQGSGKIYGIDPWDSAESAEGMTGANEDWWKSVDHEAIYQGLVKKIAKFKLKNTIELLRCSSEDAPAITNIDLLHIDGNHSEEASYFDVVKFVPLVNSGGFVIFDDINWSTTSRAVQWLNEHCTKLAEYNDSSVWGVWQVN